MKTNERQKSPRPKQPKTTGNSDKKKRGLTIEVRFWPLQAIFLGLGWPWVAKFVGFMQHLYVFSSNRDSVNRKHPCDGGATR